MRELTESFWEQDEGNPSLLLSPSARNRGYKLSEEFFDGRFPYLETEKLGILGLNPSETDIDDEHIGRENYDRIRDRFTEGRKLKFLTLHHHLVPVPHIGRERNIPVDAGEMMKLCVDVGIDFVLSGHKHISWI